MPADPRRSLQEAAARPEQPPDVEAIQKRGRRLRGLRVVGALGVIAAVLLVATATVALVEDDRKDLPPTEPGPSASQNEYVTHEEDSPWPFTVRVPAEWHWAEDSMTPKLVDPRELFATGTFPLEFRDTDCSHLPGSVLRDISSTDAFVTVQERLRGSETYPARPADLRAEARPAEGFECVPEQAPYDTYWITFSDSDRNFYALLAIGKDAHADTIDDAWATLNSFKPRPWDGVEASPTDDDGEEAGGRIAFSSNRGPGGGDALYIAAPDGSGLRPVPGGEEASSVGWSPDGSQLVFSRGINESHGELVIVNVDGGEQQVLVGDSEQEQLLVPRSPSWSPTGRTIAFASGSGDLYLVERDGSGLERVYEPERSCNAWDPEWSPDGMRIVYALECGPDGGIYTMHLDGVDHRRITDVAGDGEPDWSPDGHSIVFSREGKQIYRVDVEGGGPATPLTDSADSYSPSWSPDGKAIVFGSTRNGEPVLYVMDADGANQRALLEGEAVDVYPDWGP